MSRRACLYLGGSFVLAALAGCGGGWFLEQREPWRHEAEVACLKSGAVKESAAIAQLPGQFDDLPRDDQTLLGGPAGRG